MNWPLFLGSLAAILTLAAIAWAMGLGGATLDEDAARAEAEAQMPGFEAREVRLTAADGAEVTGIDGRTLRLRRLGARFVAEEWA